MFNFFKKYFQKSKSAEDLLFSHPDFQSILEEGRQWQKQKENCRPYRHKLTDIYGEAHYSMIFFPIVTYNYDKKLNRPYLTKQTSLDTAENRLYRLINDHNEFYCIHKPDDTTFLIKKDLIKTIEIVCEEEDQKGENE